MARFYAAMCVIGTVPPYAALFTWAYENGALDIGASECRKPVSSTTHSRRNRNRNTEDAVPSSAPHLFCR